jgi:hypothetical protein
MIFLKRVVATAAIGTGETLYISVLSAVFHHQSIELKIKKNTGLKCPASSLATYSV